MSCTTPKNNSTTTTITNNNNTYNNTNTTEKDNNNNNNYNKNTNFRKDFTSCVIQMSVDSKETFYLFQRLAIAIVHLKVIEQNWTLHSRNLSSSSCSRRDSIISIFTLGTLRIKLLWVLENKERNNYRTSNEENSEAKTIKEMKDNKNNHRDNNDLISKTLSRTIEGRHRNGPEASFIHL